MKNNQKGFVIPIIITVVVLIIIGGIYYIGKENKYSKEEGWKIMCALEDKSKTVSYSYDMVMPDSGVVVKRMYFDVSSKFLGSTWIRNGEKYIFISKENGSYEYFPDKKIAYFTPAKETPSALVDKKCTREDVQNYTLVKEDRVKDKDCYKFKILTNNSEVLYSCISKETGLNLSLEDKGGIVWYYDNYEFNIDKNRFELPLDVKIIQK